MEPEYLGWDWLVHYRADEADDFTSMLSVFDLADASKALAEAIHLLGPSREIIGIIRRDLIANADEVLGSGRAN